MRVVVVGSGVAGMTCADALNKAGARVTLLTQETAGYYSRPLLSHGFSRADIETRIMLRDFASLSDEGVRVFSGCEAVVIERAERCLLYRRNGEPRAVAYDRLVLALGSAAFIPPTLLAGGSGGFNVLNTLNDLLALRRLRERVIAQGRVPRWALIGGGLIGCELASDLAKAGDAVTIFHGSERLMERQLEEVDSTALLALFQRQGIEVKLSVDVRGVQQAKDCKKDCKQVVTARGEVGGFDCVLIACGFKPRTALAQSAGLAVQRGIVVDGRLTTSDPTIHAIGDVAQCVDGRIYAFITPIRHQAQWLAGHLSGTVSDDWRAPSFRPQAKIHGFSTQFPYRS